MPTALVNRSTNNGSLNAHQLPIPQPLRTDEVPRAHLRSNESEGQSTDEDERPNSDHEEDDIDA